MGKEKNDSLHIYFQIIFHWKVCRSNEQKLLTQRANGSALTSERERDFFLIFLFLACLKPGVQSVRFLPRHQGKMYISEEKLTLPTSGKSKSMILEGLGK